MILNDPAPYRRHVGRLIYITVTHPDIIHLVNILSQFMHAPRQPHMNAATRLIRYLKSTPGQGLFFPSNSNIFLQGYFDSDCASCHTTRRSTTDYCIFWVLALSLGRQRNKVLSPVPLLKLNIEQWAMQLVKLLGSHIF